ncbi:MAG: hypothetical protein V1725_03055 [archaeon]
MRALPLLAVLSCLLLMLSACRLTDVDRNIITGKDGLVVSFLKEQPPQDVLESSYVPFALLVENKGTFNMANDTRAKLSLSYDPYYLEVSEDNGIPPFPRGIGLLYGKSLYYPNGDSTIMQGILHFKSIKGQREHPETTISAVLCFPYQTSVSQTVCVDTSKYSENYRKQVCTAKQLSLSSQGAPIAVTMISPEIYPVQGGDYYKPQFKIDVSNVGGGTVLNPGDPEDFDSACFLQGLNRSEIDVVRVSAALGSRELQCSPQNIKLIDDKGFTRCTARDDDVVLGVSDNYESNLFITLTYVYQSGAQAKVRIERSTIEGDTIINPPNECLNRPDGELCFNSIMVCRANECISKCYYCVDNPDAALCQNAWLTPTFSCSCTEQECNALRSQGKCVTGYYCPGNKYCCESSDRGFLVLKMKQIGGVQQQDVRSPMTLAANTEYEFWGYAGGPGITTCAIDLTTRNGTQLSQDNYPCNSEQGGEQQALQHKLTLQTEHNMQYRLHFNAYVQNGNEALLSKEIRLNVG